MLADDHLLRRLAEQYPACFKLVGQERQPVKIGIGDELAALDTGLTPLQLHRALATYVRHSGYQCNIREGVNRIGLDGMPVGVITVEEAAHAKKMLARLAAKRTRQDAAKARLEQTAQPPRNEPQSALADEAELPKAAVAPSGRLSLAGLRRAALSRRHWLSPTGFSALCVDVGERARMGVWDFANKLNDLRGGGARSGR